MKRRVVPVSCCQVFLGWPSRAYRVDGLIDLGICERRLLPLVFLEIIRLRSGRPPDPDFGAVGGEQHHGDRPVDAQRVENAFPGTVHSWASKDCFVDTSSQWIITERMMWVSTSTCEIRSSRLKKEAFAL